MTAPATVAPEVAPTPVFAQVLRSQRRPLVASSALFISHQAGEALVPVVAGVLIDRAIVTADGGALLRWLVVLAVVFAVLSTSWRWGDRIFTAGYERAGHELRLRIAARATAPGGRVRRAGAGEVVSVASSDVDASVSVMEVVASLAAGLMGIVVAAIALFVISPVLGLLVLVGMPPVLLALKRLVGPIEARYAEQQAVVAEAASTATDVLRGLRVVKGLHVEANAAARYRVASRSSLVASLRATRLYAAQGGLTAAVTGGFVAAIALVGGRLAADGRISIGALVGAVGVTQFLVGPLERVGWAIAELGSARASAARVAAVLDAPPAVVDGTVPVDAATAAGSVRFDDVRHASLAGLSLEVPAGRLVGIAASEADGTALVDLLARATDPDGGVLALDGTPYPDLLLDQLRDVVLVAEHDAPLFTATVAENLAPGATGAPPIEHHLVAASADDVVGSLPDGLRTPVTERGLSLSGGQRQRVALARALVADPAVLVLHDPTTAIDSVTEARIAQGLRDVRRGRTTIVLTTSPALLAAADDVVFVADGAVADRGAHADLVDRNPAYVQAVLT